MLGGFAPVPVYETLTQPVRWQPSPATAAKAWQRQHGFFAYGPGKSVVLFIFAAVIKTIRIRRFHRNRRLGIYGIYKERLR
jgi:hypothetical protein